MYSSRFDSHTHSENSFDGHHSVIFLCENAQRKGLLGIAVTDHFDIDLAGEQHNLQRLARSQFQVCKARAAFGESFVISAGLELGEPMDDYPLAEQVLSAQEYDVVLGSIHTLAGGVDPYRQNFIQDDPYAMLDGYFQRMLELSRWGKYDVLAHLTYPMRYVARDGRFDVTLERYDDIIDEILRINAQGGKALEINTAGLRTPLGQLMPSLEQLRRFRELGGQAVTIGSDAHWAGDLGGGIEAGMELAQAAGFSHFAFYKGREPRMLKLI